MAREKEMFRENLQGLREIFGEREIISLAEAARYVGRDARTLKRLDGFPAEPNGNRYIVRTRRLANWLS